MMYLHCAGKEGSHRRRTLTEEVRQRIRARYHELEGGKTERCAHIADELGYTTSTICRVMTEAGVVSERSIPEEVRKKVRLAFHQTSGVMKHRLIEVGRRFKIHPSSVHHIITEEVVKKEEVPQDGTFRWELFRGDLMFFRDKHWEG